MKRQILIILSFLLFAATAFAVPPTPPCKTVTGLTDASSVAITGGTIAGATITENFTTSTDPLTNAAVTTAIVNAYNGVVVTLTGAGNTQTIQNPTTTATIRKFMVINNDTSNNNLSVVANSVTFVLTPGEGQCFLWDGSAWGPTDLGITSIPVPVTQGGTGRATGTTAYALVATGTTATGAQQTLAKAGAATEILVGGGESALPVWTIATGSGAPVRATSPTLVTPVLGTPASGDISACTGTPTINVTLPDAGKITLDIAPASDHTATGIQFSATAGEALAYGNVCYLKSDGKYWKIDADAAATMPATVMALATIAGNAAGNFLDYGWARDDSWSWTIGRMVYASTDSGGLTQTAPSGEADTIQIVGKAETATVLKFAPSWITAEVGLDVVNLGTATSTTITFAEMSAVPKTWMADHSSDQTITFAAPTAADVGKRFTILKNGTGAGKLIVDAPSGVYLHSAAASSGDGGTAYLAASARGSMTWFVVSATEIQLLNADGTVTFI